MFASHTEFLEETFETALPKGALAAMATFSQMRLGVTAWAVIYLVVVQKVSNAMPIRGAARRAASSPHRSRRHGAHQQPCSAARGIQRAAIACAPLPAWPNSSFHDSV
jgi:hypothetical protein